MKKQSWLLLLLLLIVSCSPAVPTSPSPEAPAAIPDADSPTADTDEIEGIVVPAQQAQLSFLLSGSIIEITVAEGDTVQAGDKLMVVSAANLDSAVLAAEASLRAAVADLQYWLLPRKNKPHERRWLAEARVAAAEAVLATTLEAQKQAVLVAPFDATVIEIDVAPGEVVNPGQRVILLADLGNLEIKTIDLSERVVPNIEIGHLAIVYIKALDTKLNGQVTAISPISSASGGDVVYTTTIQLDEIPNDLRWGMSTTVEIHAE